MATVVIMPKQGQSVESCIITGWNKKKGDMVAKGDILFAYETDKASFEEEATVDGILLDLFFEAGEDVPVLTNVCVIGAAGEAVEKYRPQGFTPGISDNPEPEETTGADAVNMEASGSGSPNPWSVTGAISPRAKNLAIKEGILTEGLAGTGPGGRIIEKDVLGLITGNPKTTPLARKIAGDKQLQVTLAGSGLAGAVTAKDLTAPLPGNDFEIKKLSNIRKMIAKAMFNSLQNSAQLTHHLGADARRILELRRKVKKATDSGYPVNITINDMVCFAVVKALQKFPQANGHFLGDSMKYFNKINLGVAVDTDRGLMVPVIKIQGLSDQMRDIAAMCRKGAVNPELLSSEAASFTVSNLGNYGVEIFTPVINLPQVAILGVNTIVPRPKDLGDGVYGFVPFIGLSLTYDHQALDGGEATRFLKQIALEIENLEFEL
jgi:pyruvate dehydrogenase E2 component (dihydrolipoamide acetyltransferase)